MSTLEPSSSAVEYPTHTILASTTGNVHQYFGVTCTKVQLGDRPPEPIVLATLNRGSPITHRPELGSTSVGASRRPVSNVSTAFGQVTRWRRRGRVRCATTAVFLTSLLPAGATLAAQQATRSPADTARLEPIVVTANRTTAPAASLPSATSVIDVGPVLRGHRATGLDEVLDVVPGLVVNNRFNPAQGETLSIRGFGARAAFGLRGVTVLLDGIPQTLPDGQSELTAVELSEVTGIEVMRGAAATLYGNGAGGVISLSTADPMRRTPLTHGSAIAGAFGLTKVLAGATVPVGGGDLRITGSRVTSDGYRTHGAGERRHLDGQLTVPLGAHTRVIATIVGADDPVLQDPGALTAAEMDSNPRMANPRNLSVNAGKAVTEAEAGVTVEHRSTGGAVTDLTVFGLLRSLHNPIAATVIDLKRQVGGFRFSGTVPWTLGGRLATLTLGVDAQEQRDDRQNHDFSNTLTLNQLERVTSVGPFAHAVVRLPDRFTVTAGVRYDRLTFRADDHLLTNGDQSGRRVLASPSASLGLGIAATRGLTVFADVGTAFETPTTTELANQPDGSGGFNATLNPEHAVQLETGWRLRWPAGRFELAAYTTHVIDELIPFEVPGQPGRKFYRNAGSATHRGIETSTELRPIADVTLEAAYTYTHLRFDNFRTATDTLDGNAIPGVPTHSGMLALRFTHGPWWFNAEETMRSATWANDQNAVRASGWALTALYVGFDRRLRGVTIAPSLGVTNLFDTRYVANVVVNANADHYFEPGAARAVFGDVSVTW